MAFQSKSPKGSFVARVTDPRVRFWVLAAFVVIVALMGGGSRADSLATVVVRPVAFLCLAYSLLTIDRDELATIRIPLLLLLALVGWVTIQLIPLPPGMWQALPGRMELGEMYRTVGLDLPWLPLALSPSRATNTLMSLSVPLAALTLFALQDDKNRRRAWTLLWAMVIVSVVVGMAQLAGSGGRALYFHRISNTGLPVGLFANRNHQALFVCVGIILAAAKYAAESRHGQRFALSAVLSLGSMLVFVPFLLTVGSRAGLIIGTAMLLPAFGLVYRAILEMTGDRTGGKKRRYLKIVFGTVVASAAGLFAAAIMFSRSLAFDRLVEKGGGDGVRSETLPIILDMTVNSLPFGIGFGAFEFAYRRVEPIDLLLPSYINQAHNDWVQFVLEGGIPAALLLLAFVVWFSFCSVRVAKASLVRLRPYGIVAIGAILALAVASIVDYPLRTPTLAMVFAFACVQLAIDGRRIAVARQPDGR